MQTQDEPGVNAPAQVGIALIGTSDLHGYVEPTTLTVKDAQGVEHSVRRGGLSLLGGYVDNVRKRMPVVLLDGGDLFQGTLVSNLNEGQAVIDGYNALGYTAAAIGNHEFDYGPQGPKSVPITEQDDPNGALKARIAAARFPFLSANLLDKKIGLPVGWPNLYPSKMVVVAGVPIGLVGALTEDTPRTTNVLNLRDVTVGPIISAVRAQAQNLRRNGAAAVFLTIHEGAHCRDFSNPRDSKPCENEDGRVVPIARALHDVIDAVVAGHSHAGIAHFVDGVPVIQAFAYGRAFARADLWFRKTQNGFVLDKSQTRIYPPTEVCSVQVPSPKPGVAAGPKPIQSTCEVQALSGQTLRPAVYENLPVTDHAGVQLALEPHIARAAQKKSQALAVSLHKRLPRQFKAESPLGQFLADLTQLGATRIAQEPVDLALQNGGGIRNELPQGPLTYGHVFEVLPFDNRLALLRMPGQAIIELFSRNLAGSHGVLIPSTGFTVASRCETGLLAVDILGPGGKPIDRQRNYTVAVSDFLALGGDAFGAVLPRLGPGAVRILEDTSLREVIVEQLRLYQGPFLQSDTMEKRLLLPMPRPVRCK